MANPDRERPKCIIRRIKPADFPAVATLSAEAMMDDELMKVICPKRKEYYSHFRDSFLRRLRLRYWKPGHVIFVAVTIPDHQNAAGHEKDGKIVGLCAWERSGESPEARSWINENDWWGSKLQQFRYRTVDSAVYYFFPDKSVDQSKLALHLSSVDCFSSDIFAEMWFLGVLAVDPDYQGQGIGRLLTQWGIDQANKERLPIGIESSIKGRILYEKLGFRVFKTVAGLDGVETPMMIWEPEVSEEESWYERAKKDALGN